MAPAAPDLVEGHSRLKGGAIVYVLPPVIDRDSPHRSLFGRLPHSTSSLNVIHDSIVMKSGH